MEYETKIINPRPEIDTQLVAKCQAMTSVLSATAVFSDAQNREGVMDHEIKFRSVNKPFIGTALTVKLKPGDIVDCLPIFDIAQPGDVVVIDANGTPNTSVWGGLMADEFSLDLRHDSRGVVSMASSKPDQVGSQFFITYAAQSHLDGQQSVVGKVLFGWDTLDKMERVPVKGKKYRPEQDISLNSVTVHANPFADKLLVVDPPVTTARKKQFLGRKKRIRKRVDLGEEKDK